MARQLRSSKNNKRPRPETEGPRTEAQTATEAPPAGRTSGRSAPAGATTRPPATGAAWALALATVRANILAICILSVESWTDLIAHLPEGTRVAVLGEFPDLVTALRRPRWQPRKARCRSSSQFLPTGRTAWRPAERSSPRTGWGLPRKNSTNQHWWTSKPPPR